MKRMMFVFIFAYVAGAHSMQFCRPARVANGIAAGFRAVHGDPVGKDGGRIAAAAAIAMAVVGAAVKGFMTIAEQPK